MKSTFKAFSSRNYRLYFTGQCVSLIGTWMQRTAVYWIIYEKTNSPFMLGVAVFATQFPSFLFSILGGVVSDRYDRFKVLITTQTLSLLQAAVLAFLAFNDYEVWQILTLSVVLGIINAFDIPARQAMIYDMVASPNLLPNAIALNSSTVHAARLVGPAVAGIVVETLGAAICFTINAISFVVVMVCLLMMSLPAYQKPARVQNAWGDLKNGWQYLKATPAIGYVMLMLASVSLFSLPYVTVLPVYAKEIFSGQAAIFGYLNSSVGVGALVGAIFLASRPVGTNLRYVLLINTIVFGIALIVFSMITHLALALIVIGVAGFGMMSQTTITNTLIQTTVSPEMRGRVISYYAMAFFGMQPVGGILVGLLADSIGVQNTFIVQGLCTLAIVVIFFPLLSHPKFYRKDRMEARKKQTQSINKQNIPDG